jgi:8-oxo-dGTP pyrophosphatase MutT (NUDIX family)
LKKALQAVLFCLFAVVLLSCSGEKLCDAAGTIIYSKHQGEIWLLLADHKNNKRGWASFGGGCRKRETAVDAAARETWEETRGYFSREEILQKINPEEPVETDGYIAYLVEVEFVESDAISENRLPKKETGFRERGPYAWIALEDVFKVMDSGDPSWSVAPELLPKNKHPWLYNKFLNSVFVARQLGYLPK